MVLNSVVWYWTFSSRMEKIEYTNVYNLDGRAMFMAVVVVRVSSTQDNGCLPLSF